MFIGRETELSTLERLYESDKFEFLVMYGRRRVGKTEILKEFSKRHKTLFYSALEKKTNLGDFSNCVFNYYGVNVGMKFNGWEDAFSYVSEHATTEKTVVIIDEFPYIVKEEAVVKSMLQHAIDHKWKEKYILLILCGSSVSFMVSNIMGRKSPLYGRNTAVMEVKPFDYSYVSRFLPSYSAEDKLRVYGILGGVPYYLSQFSDRKTLTENIAERLVDVSSTLRDEPVTLLKSELREPATYNSIIEAIAGGATKLSEIASKVGIEPTKVSVYIKTLQEMRLVEKITPCGRKESGKISQNVIGDNFFSFWYRFIFSQKTRMEFMESIDFSKEIVNNLSDYMGLKFEKICMEYLIAQGKKGMLPFIPSKLGKWWGTNPDKKAPDDIDIMGIDGTKYLFCECKFRNELFDLAEFNDLISASNIFKGATEKYYYIFVKSGYTQAVITESSKYNVKLLTISDLFGKK